MQTQKLDFEWKSNDFIWTQVAVVCKSQCTVLANIRIFQSIRYETVLKYLKIPETKYF